MPKQKRGFTPLEMNESLSKSNGNTSARRITKKKRFLSLTGFTLIELMIVVVIIGALAGIAIPRFIRTAEKVKGDEAITKLKLIFIGEGMYRVGVNSFTGTLSDLYPDYIENPNANPDRAFDYTIPAFTATTFTARATRKGTGIYGGLWIEIRQDEKWNSASTWPWVPQPQY